MTTDRHRVLTVPACGYLVSSTVEATEFFSLVRRHGGFDQIVVRICGLCAYARLRVFGGELEEF